MELEIFEALTAINIPADKARTAAQSIDRAIDRRYELHAKQLATRGDVEQVRKEVGDVRKDMAEMESRLLRAMSEMQRWTLTAILAGLSGVAVITKLWH